MRKSTAVILILLLIVHPGACFAWSEGGHHLIAAIAFSLLTDQERSELLDVLKKHPRFAEDFVPPEKLANDEERTRWLVGRAGYWPDVARKQPKYHRSTWHYELGPTIVLGQADTLEVPDRPGPLPLDATLESQDLYLSQAVELCRKVLSDKSKPAGDRAIALCWIAHLVGDAHQPCHAGSLYMEKVFVEEDGDRGANRILTKQRKNMHALWDQLLGDEFTLNGTRKRIVEITGDADLIVKARFAISTSGGIEHVYPQTPGKPWAEAFKGVKSRDKVKYAGSLGNMLLLSASVNSALQNDGFDDKKHPKHNEEGEKVRNGFSDGSHSEIEVSKLESWGPQEIRDRGIKLLKFMEKRWGLQFANAEGRDSMLFLPE